MCVYSGTMTSFCYASMPTCGNWFQTKQLKHESDDHIIKCFLVCHQWERHGTSDHHLSLNCGLVKPKLQIGLGYWHRMGYDFQNLLTILAQFLEICTWKQIQF